MKRILLVLILLVSSFLLKTQISEASVEKILSFTATYQILPDASLNVTETIVHDFGENQKHGIFREIPLTITNQSGKKFRLKVENVRVTNWSNSTNLTNDLLTIKIGNPNVLVTGIKTYEISYTVLGAPTYFSDHDELYWNITGNSWQVPIEKTQASIFLPETGLIKKVACYTGAKDATAGNCQTSFLKNNALFTTGNLNSGEGLTIVVSFQKNVIAEVLPKEDKPSIMSMIFTLVISLLGFLYYLVFPLWIIFRWWQKGRDPKTNPNVVITFDPPKDQKGKFLHPAEVGTLIDESADNKDLSATIIDLAIKGFLKIKKEKGDNYTFIKLKDFKKDATLKNYEKNLLTGIFDEGKEAQTADLQETFYTTAQEVKDSLYETLTSGGFFVANPQKVRTKYYVLAGVALFTANFFLAIVSFFFGRQMPKKTVFGSQARMMALGMKKFLVTQERQLEFQAKNWLFFEKLLPFAVVFNCEKIWAERFRDLTVTPPTWYEGDQFNQFNTLIFVSSLNNSISSFSSMATPTTSSSGFSSGFSGGSSGGGGGGGGGGSW